MGTMRLMRNIGFGLCRKPFLNFIVCRYYVISKCTIRNESTPNENAIKFIPNDSECRIPQYLQNSEWFISQKNQPEIVRSLFAIHGVESIFFGRNFITVNKDGMEWSEIIPQITDALMNFLESENSKKEIEENSDVSESVKSDQENEFESGTVKMIKELLEIRIRPFVQMDGGDVSFVTFNETNGILAVRLKGACSSCSMSSATLQQGISTMMKHYIPEVTDVVQVQEEWEKQGIKQFEDFNLNEKDKK